MKLPLVRRISRENLIGRENIGKTLQAEKTKTAKTQIQEFVGKFEEY